MTRQDRGRGGKGGHEPRLRIRHREQEVIRLATEGHSQHEIAKRVGTSQSAVSQIIRRVDERWLRDNADRLTRYRVEQTRKLDYLYRTALRGWEDSKTQHTRRRQRKSGGEGGGGSGGTVAEIVVDDSHGDARFLEAARRALVDLNRLWGLDRLSRPDPSDDAPAVFTLQLDRGPSDGPGPDDNKEG
jgi:predicted transcriptional regulator